MSREENDLNEWIMVVDDDIVNLRAASRILMENGMRASCVKSGEEALRFLSDGAHRPDLVLLDIHMPGMDGFKTLSAMQNLPEAADIPVVFLTADEDSETESQALEAGATDFIKKPFVPRVLLTRVRRIVELNRLQNHLEEQVREQTRAVVEKQKQLARLSMQVVETLAGTVDAKDPYTNGHSRRVAEYAREITIRWGYSGEKSERIFMMGLLHDIGKIGIPDDIIKKDSALTDEEYALTKQHPVLGAKILGNIPDFPELAVGARWHHERMDGKGYPDGIAGDQIPEEARIIAVADSYDAMASRRSYRDVLPQAEVRTELAKGRGTQFDPAFVDIMLCMIDEDKDYRMRQK